MITSYNTPKLSNAELYQPASNDLAYTLKSDTVFLTLVPIGGHKSGEGVADHQEVDGGAHQPW